MKNKTRKFITSVLALVILFTSITMTKPIKSEAASYCKISTYIVYLVREIGLPTDGTTSSDYLRAAKKAGIVKDGEFKKYTALITRTDVALLASRADEYLHGDTVSEELLTEVLAKRISDIKSIPSAKKTAVAKAFANGLITGYSNGTCSTNRAFKGNTYISRSGAKGVAKKVAKPSLRTPMSPDGQVCRTTKLPRNAKRYEYILASFPNSFYELNFQFNYRYTKTQDKKPEYGSRYIYPVDVTEIGDQALFRETYMNDWVKLAQQNMEARFNINYKTIEKDTAWFKKIRDTYMYYEEAERKNSNEKVEKSIKDYISLVKENKVTIETSRVTVDPSMSYVSDGDLYLRVYVKFRITSANDISDVGKLFYTDLPSMKNLKKNHWIESYYDIEVGTYKPAVMGDKYRITNDYLNDYINEAKGATTINYSNMWIPRW